MAGRGHGGEGTRWGGLAPGQGTPFPPAASLGVCAPLLPQQRDSAQPFPKAEGTSELGVGNE